MRKLFWSLAATALILSGCSKEGIDSNPNNDIGNTMAFGTAVGTQTKAAEMELDGLKTAASSASTDGKYLPVWLFKTTTFTPYESGDVPPKTLGQLRLVWQNNRWNMWRLNSGSWAEDNNILYATTGADFYSYYSPKSVAAAADEKPVLVSKLTDPTTPAGTFEYTVGGLDVTPKAFNQEDLLVANKITNQTQGKVTLALKHALAQINFALKDDDRYVFFVSQIEAMDVNNQATWDFTTNNWGTPTGKVGYSYLMDGTNKIDAATMAASRGWNTTAPGYVNNDVTTITNTLSYKNLNNGFQFDEGQAGDPITYTQATDAAYRKAKYKLGNNGLMIMPQELKENTQRMRIRVYTVEKGGSTTINGKSYNFTTENTNTGKDFYVDFKIPTNAPTAYENKWKNGLRYLYILDMASIVGLDNYLSFDVQVTEWENYDMGGANKGEVGITDLTLFTLPSITTVNGYSSGVEYPQPSAGVFSIVNMSNNNGFDLSTATFPNLTNANDYFVLDYSNVQFTADKTGFSIALPTGYVIAAGATSAAAKTAAENTATNNYLVNYYKGTNNNTDHFVCIVKKTVAGQKRSFALVDPLKTAFEAAGTDLNFVGNSSAIDVTTWNTTALVAGTYTINVLGDKTPAPVGSTGTGWSYDAGTGVLEYTK